MSDYSSKYVVTSMLLNTLKPVEHCNSCYVCVAAVHVITFIG